VLEARLDEAYATDKKQVEEIICAFCCNLPVNPVMCSECEKVFCLEDQKIYFSKTTNETCCHCRVKPKNRFKPLNRKLRRLL